MCTNIEFSRTQTHSCDLIVKSPNAEIRSKPKILKDFIGPDKVKNLLEVDSSLASPSLVKRKDSNPV
jgi:Holliday junction resolvasome RuvABC ATP-dependent DNA helicase subunit